MVSSSGRIWSVRAFYEYVQRSLLFFVTDKPDELYAETVQQLVHLNNDGRICQRDKAIIMGWLRRWENLERVTQNPLQYAIESGVYNSAKDSSDSEEVADNDDPSDHSERSRPKSAKQTRLSSLSGALSIVVAVGNEVQPTFPLLTSKHNSI